MIAAGSQLGLGIYTPQEAAMYARVKTQLLNRWLFGNKRGAPVIRPQLESEERTVTFLDFIQTLAVRGIRTQYGRAVSLERIRLAAEVAREKFGIEYPFARRHETYLIREGKHAGEIVLKVNDQYIQVTGRAKDQQLIGPIAELYLDDVTFDRDGLASEYRPFAAPNAGAILMDPHRRFGEPLVEQCGYSARTLWEATIAEGGLEAAATAFGVDVRHVRLACAYFDHLNVAV